jgi:hypothetical protein
MVTEAKLDERREAQMRRILASIPTPYLLSEAGKRRRAKQTSPPVAEVLRPCPHCGEQLGARKLRKHAPPCRRAKLAERAARFGKGQTPESAAARALEECREACPERSFSNPALLVEMTRLAEDAAARGESLTSWRKAIVVECIEFHSTVPLPEHLWGPRGSWLYQPPVQ